MNDITKPIGQWIGENIPLSVGIVLFIFLALFDISKVKIYPLRWLWKLIKWPFKILNQRRKKYIVDLIDGLKTDIDIKLTDLNSGTNKNCDILKTRFDSLEGRFDKLDEKQSETEEKLDRLAAARIKNHVLNFARQCRTGVPHSHEDFANLFEENKEYQKLVEKYKWENDVYKHDFAYINDVYDECNRNNSFSDSRK